MAGTKFFPVPDASTCTSLMDLEPSPPLNISTVSRPLTRNMRVDDCAHPLKSVMLAENSPFLPTGTGVELPRVWAMFTLPQGELVEGN